MSVLFQLIQIGISAIFSIAVNTMTAVAPLTVDAWMALPRAVYFTALYLIKGNGDAD